MAQIYGELIRAQLQVSASDLTPTATGLVYFNSSTGLKWHTGSGWKTAVDLDSTQSLAGKTLDSSCNVDAGSLPIVSLEKGGLGLDATTITGLVRISSPGGVSAGQINSTDIPDLTVLYSKLDLADGDIPQAKVENLTTDLSAKVSANAGITAATKTKITYDDKGLVTAGADLVSADIPATLLSKVVSSTAAMTGALTLPVGSTGDRAGLSTQGMVRYNTTDATFEGYNGSAWGAIGGGGGGTIDTVTQASHGFVVGDVLYLNGATYTKAIATSAAAAEVVGVVSSVITSSQFQLTLSGEVSGLSGLTAGEVYFLSAATAGLLTLDEPTVVGQVSVPVGVASSTTSLYVAPKRGSVVGSSNVRTQIALSNNATTTVQNIAAYDAGELTGWVSITATTPLRFYVAAQFSKNGAANNYNVSYQASGDTPPTGFVVTATAGGLLQITLPSVTGFASASINFALNAPAIGTSFPLTVSARNVVGDTSGTAVPAGYVGERITWAVAPSTQALTLTETDWTNAVINLTAGTWQIFANIQISYDCGATAGSFGRSEFKVTDSSNNLIQNLNKQIATRGALNFVSSVLASSGVVTISSNTSYKIRVLRADLTGANTGNVLNTTTAFSEFYAIRIA